MDFFSTIAVCLILLESFSKANNHTQNFTLNEENESQNNPIPILNLSSVVEQTPVLNENSSLELNRPDLNLSLVVVDTPVLRENSSLELKPDLNLSLVVEETAVTRESSLLKSKPNVNVTSVIVEALTLAEKLPTESRYDPLPLPGLADHFEKDNTLPGLLINLTNGMVHNNSKISLGSDFIGIYASNLITSGEFILSDLTVEYDYSASFSGMSDHGKLNMFLKNITLTFESEYNVASQKNVEVIERLTKFEILGPYIQSKDNSSNIMKESFMKRRVESHYKWKILGLLESALSQVAKDSAELLSPNYTSCLVAAITEALTKRK